MPKTSKNDRKLTVTPNEKIYKCKMIRKIQSIHLYWLHACLNNLTLLFRSKHDNALYKFLI